MAAAKPMAISLAPAKLLQFDFRTGAELEQTGVLQCSSPPYRGRSNWSGAPATGAQTDWSSSGDLEGPRAELFVAVRTLSSHARSRSPFARARNNELAPPTFVVGPLLDSDQPLLPAYA